MKLLAMAFFCLAMLTSCAALKGFALDALSPSKGGINTEIVLGDKEQTLGTNQEVKANNVGTVVGQNDNHTDIKSAEEVSITNQNYPAWLVLLLLIGGLLGWLTDTPQTMWSKYRRKKDEN